MKLSVIVTKLRDADIDPFFTNIAGAAEFGSVQENTLVNETAYVFHVDEIAAKNDFEHDTSQKIIESFAVVVALKNDLSQADKTGLTAFDRLHNIRKQLLNTLLGWEIPDDDSEDGYHQEGPIYYKGGRLAAINPAWLWYQYTFEFDARIDRVVSVIDVDVDDFNTINVDYILTPSAQIPLKGAKAIPDAGLMTDLDQIIDLTENLAAGAFSRAFSSGYDLYDG